MMFWSETARCLKYVLEAAEQEVHYEKAWQIEIYSACFKIAAARIWIKISEAATTRYVQRVK